MYIKLNKHNVKLCIYYKNNPCLSWSLQFVSEQPTSQHAIMVDFIRTPAKWRLVPVLALQQQRLHTFNVFVIAFSRGVIAFYTMRYSIYVVAIDCISKLVVLVWNCMKLNKMILKYVWFYYMKWNYALRCFISNM